MYLDWNATTPPHPSVLAAWSAALSSGWANASSVHRAGQRARALLDAAREAVALLLGFEPGDVALTSGGTEANNLALLGLFPPGATGAVVVGGVEHPSVARAAASLAARGIAVEVAAPAPSGRVEPAAVARALAALPNVSGPRVVSLQSVNHETGVLQPVAEVAALAHRARALLHVDAVQGAGKLERSAWGDADLVTMAGHKIRGPKGTGAVAWRRGVRLVPVLAGGAQERGLRPGTQDAAAAAGLAVACRRAPEHRAATAAVAPLRDRLERELVDAGARLGIEVVRNGTAERVAHVSSLAFVGWRGAELCAALDLEGVAVSSGAACSAGTPEASAVVAAMAGAARAEATVRLSLGETTTAREVEVALEAFRRVLARGPAPER
ncbi:MAG: aminotransferase class V-fold PLP-dependent enzyme [Myxococcales bacterium]|nr:aminotransferase class V-fold PLP-dependent enzyme [Myxococcales bacterium]